MVIRPGFCFSRAGSLMVELLVAMAIVGAILLPIAYSIAAERRLTRAIYQRAIAMELVDGEMEVLAAGGWRAYTNGVTEYAVHSQAMKNLPAGGFTLTMTLEKMRLEWKPSVKMHGGAVAREVQRK